MFISTSIFEKHLVSQNILVANMKQLEDNSNHYIINLVYMPKEYGKQGRKIMTLIKMEVQKIALNNIYQC